MMNHYNYNTFFKIIILNLLLVCVPTHGMSSVQNFFATISTKVKESIPALAVGLMLFSPLLIYTTISKINNYNFNKPKPVQEFEEKNCVKLFKSFYDPEFRAENASEIKRFGVYKYTFQARENNGQKELLCIRYARRIWSDLKNKAKRIYTQKISDKDWNYIKDKIPNKEIQLSDSWQDI